jgi:hypothetical protein
MKCKLITTVSDLNHPGYKNLVRSLEKFEWDWEVCGMQYQAFGSKMVNAYNYAKTTDCTHLFIVDAYDVIALGSMQEALDGILDKDVILFGAEINAWPYEQWAYLYPSTKSRFKYLNGGVSFVSVELFCRMFEENPITIIDNDQVCLAKTFITKGYKYDMELDTNCQVFQNLCGTLWTDFNFVNGRIINKETLTTPVLVHGNGQADMSKIIELI